MVFEMARSVACDHLVDFNRVDTNLERRLGFNSFRFDSKLLGRCVTQSHRGQMPDCVHEFLKASPAGNLAGKWEK